MVSSKKAFEYFEAISIIPRQSGDERAIADYIESFAVERGLFCYRDEYNNVLVKKPGNSTDGDCPPIIVQGHTDMVYVREPDCSGRYEDGLKLLREDGWIFAEGTSLGADDGVAVAYMLALLDSDDIRRPDIEALFTASEEVGLVGANHFDCSRLNGKYLINLDMEAEGTIYVSCAGGCRHDILIPMKRESVKGLSGLSLSIEGLLGGHSGSEIDKGRANAVVLMGRLLTALGDKIRIAGISAEGKDNAICNNCRVRALASEEDMNFIIDTISQYEGVFTEEYGDADDITIGFGITADRDGECYTAESVKRLCGVIALTPCGALDYSRRMPGLVETSSNIGVLMEDENNIGLFIQSRSLSGSRLDELKERFSALAGLTGCEDRVGSQYPQWEYRENSRLRDLAAETFRQLFGREAEVRSVHAGLECGFFSQRLPDCDIIALGPDIPNIHTTREKVSVDSFDRVWRHFIAIIEALAAE